MNSKERKKSKPSPFGLMMIAHIACCGIPILIISIGAIGTGVIINFISTTLFPLSAGVILIGLGWISYKRYRKQSMKQTSPKKY